MQQTILITGANRGIGLEMVRQYMEDGWKVLACCRAPSAAEKLQEMASGAEDLVEIHALDVTDGAQISTLSERLKDVPIDILLNNAGVYGPKHSGFGGVDTEEWLKTFRVNAVAPLKMAEAFVGQVASSRRKVVATISSLMGSIADNGSGGGYIYRTSKAGANMVMKSLAVDLKPRGIIAVALSPGWVRTDMGGANAPTAPEESVAGLRRVLAQLGPEDSGKFFHYDGRALPW
jgi:NAD(P)-dependent dehydrogenase (short-subunit alcohol dehydrogenase family)